MFKNKETGINCTVCGMHISPEEIGKGHYIAREPKEIGLAASLNGSTEPHLYDVIDCPHCGCQNILNVREIRVDEPNAGESEVNK